MKFLYGLNSLDIGDAFHVLVNNVIVREYEGLPGATCQQDCISIPAGATTVEFLCASNKNAEHCWLDLIQFHGLSRRKLDSEDNSNYSFIDSSLESSCNENTSGETCYDFSEGEEFNCCLRDNKKFACGSCSSCDGWGQLLNGRDEMGETW